LTADNATEKKDEEQKSTPSSTPASDLIKADSDSVPSAAPSKTEKAKGPTYTRNPKGGPLITEE
jgi:hypothetical protein